jgi:hypothetical protein
MSLHFSSDPCVDRQNPGQKPYNAFATHAQFCHNTSNILLLSIYHQRSQKIAIHSLGWILQQASIFVNSIRFVSLVIPKHSNCCNARKVARKPSQCKVQVLVCVYLFGLRIGKPLSNELCTEIGPCLHRIIHRLLFHKRSSLAMHVDLLYPIYVFKEERWWRSIIVDVSKCLQSRIRSSHYLLLYNNLFHGQFL